MSYCSVTQVAYLECDPGQTEFTPSACLSLILVTEPVLGMRSLTVKVKKVKIRFICVAPQLPHMLSQ